ncbi:MAG: hypothetical protein ACOY0R_16735, partial [Chloroflexota bacterium]
MGEWCPISLCIKFQNSLAEFWSIIRACENSKLRKSTFRLAVKSLPKDFRSLLFDWSNQPMAKAKLIPPYGGKLVDLVLTGKERGEQLARAAQLPSIKITMRNLCDLELIATGG